MNKCILSFVLIFFVLVEVHSEILKGRVVDAETMEPLCGARIRIEDEIPNVSTMISIALTDSLGYFEYKTQDGGFIRISATYFGYHPANIRRVDGGSNDTIRIDDIQLKPSTEVLSEVLVNAKAKRFFMNGDTVIFNPEAFNLENGDRLIALIEKLPGVSTKDGKLLWNGAPLKLMMNGKNALNEDMMLGQIPVEAVEKVKAYDRTSELQERTGVADGNEEHVLDISIKSGFMDKFCTEAEARAYAGKEYAASVNATRLSDNNPILLFGRIANEQYVKRSSSYSSWVGHYGQLPVRQQIGALAYRHLWTPDYKVVNDSYWDVTAGINHWDESTKQWEDQQNFVPGTTSTQTSNVSRDYIHNLEIPVEFSSYFNLGDKRTLTIGVNVGYISDRKSNRTEQKTFGIGTSQTPINTSTYNSNSRTSGISMEGNAKLARYFTGGSLETSLRLSYDDTKYEGSSVGEYQYSQLTTTQIEKQRFSTPKHIFNTTLGINFNRALGKAVMLHALWTSKYNNLVMDEQRWRDEVPDWANSTFRKDNNLANTLTLDANYKKRRFSIKPVIKLTHQYEHVKYRRASLDTIAQRNLLLAQPSLQLSYRLQPQMQLKGILSYINTAADILDCIAFIDDTNPLYIIKGNANLETSSSLNVRLLYTAMLTKRNQALSVGINYKKNYNPIGTILHYNSHTGAYTAQKQNMQGGDSWSGSLSYDCELTPNIRLKNTTLATSECTYGIMTIVDNTTDAIYNRQNHMNISDELGLNYEQGNWVVMNNHFFTFDRHVYSDEIQINRNIYKYSTEVSVRYQWNKWKFTLSPQYIYDYGHTSKQMNGSQVLLNMEVDYTFLKKRAQLTLAGKDLLGQKKTITSTVSSTSNTVSGFETMHQYVSLTFKYRFDPSMKK